MQDYCPVDAYENSVRHHMRRLVSSAATYLMRYVAQSYLLRHVFRRLSHTIGSHKLSRFDSSLQQTAQGGNHPVAVSLR